ncbi:MBL fold metallo-hydrolase [Gymnodinialimonas sp. 2305UL16-5]|uniref:MBL fold metallo-hydrolase n=1 Tax=Gymnodinialimonas mytili TaxID=3126503 RepID=UPI0030B175C3
MSRRSALIGLGTAMGGLSMPFVVRAQNAAPYTTSRYTYSGHGSVNTHWIETPSSVIVIDVQRDTFHAAEALNAVKAIGKPVSAILVTHGHPDHYTGLEQFRAQWPGVPIYASPETIRVVETDHYGYHQVVRELAPDAAPSEFVVPDRPIELNETLAIDGVTIETREMGPSEATSATVFYLPETQELYAGDTVLNQMHGFLYEERSGEVLDTLQRMRVLFPEAQVIHPGHGDPGAAMALMDAHEDYTETARRLVAELMSDAMSAEQIIADVTQSLQLGYPNYQIPGGQPDMIELSVGGVLAELTELREIDSSQ